jgi:hypothetical protein
VYSHMPLQGSVFLLSQNCVSILRALQAHVDGQSLHEYFVLGRCPDLGWGTVKA